MRVLSPLRSFGIALAVPGIFAASVFADAVVYDNGPGNRRTGKEMTTWVQANDFVLAVRTKVCAVQFVSFVAPGFFAGSIQWEIYSHDSTNNRPGVQLASGITTDVSHIATGFSPFSPFQEHNTAFPITPVVLPPGRYWLALHNGPESNNTSQSFYWSATDRPGTIPGHRRFAGTPGPWTSTYFPPYPDELAFQVLGAPEPGIDAIFFQNGTWNVRFTTTSGHSYRLEYKNNLQDAEWTPVPAGQRAGTGEMVSVPDGDPQAANVPRRFYRVVLL